ncbi:MAG: Hint domain-containing protein [Paracoccus sp. (in: a-proteobacteria)]
MVQINGSSGNDGATVVQATEPDGTPERDPNFSQTLSGGAVSSGSSGDFNINMSDGADTLVGENMVWLDAGSPTVAFRDVNMGGGDDYVHMTRSAVGRMNAGDGNDTVIYEQTGGSSVTMGSGDDVTRVGADPNATVSDREIYQKDGNDPLQLDGGAGYDTLNLRGEWTLTLSSGDVTIDTNGDGDGDLITNSYSYAEAPNVTNFPPLMDGTVSWGDVTIRNPDATHETVTISNEAVFSNYEEVKAVCFTAGTMIETPNGLVAIETLRDGDQVMTRNGIQTVRWVGKRRFDSIDLAGNPKMLPVRVPAGAFGNGLPKRTVCFSPQHRVLIRSSIAERMFGSREVLVPVKQLVGVNGIEVAGDIREVQYVHIMFAEHQLVEVEGIEAESLYPGPQALSFLREDQLRELRGIFPNFDEIAHNEYPSAEAIPFLKGRETRSLAARHMKNARPLYS